MDIFFRMNYTILVLLISINCFGQESTAPIPKIVRHGDHHALLVDGKPFFILGGQVHNSSAWPGLLPQVWSAIKEMHANTLEIPIYWEQIEPQPGKFDFSLVNTLLIQARQHHIRLVLLWFATWKNGSNHYMPEWMKRDTVKYPNITGLNGRPVDSPSPYATAAMKADLKAFVQVMRYLKKADTQRTVIMVQVENEPGSWGSVRDYSATAQKIFDQQVPQELLKPEILTSLITPVTDHGSWKMVFGKNADEYFHAWSIAKYIGRVAAAGKAEYPLPLYVNVALRDPITHPDANTYESGGATDNVIPIWKVAAPAIDILAPDIYISGHEKVSKVISLYDRPDNALFVPEAALSSDKAKYLYDVIARGGIGFSPFGIDAINTSLHVGPNEHLAAFSQEYEAVAPMIDELAQWGFSGKISTLIEGEDHGDQTVDLGQWRAIVSFGNNKRSIIGTTPDYPEGKLMIVKLADNKFILIGTLCHITFQPTGNNSLRAWQYLKVEEGRYKNGSFNTLRILNGDETDFGGPRFGKLPVVLQTSLVLR